MKKILALLFLAVLANPAFTQTQLYTEESFHDYFVTHMDSLDPIEGIWNVATTQEFYRYDTLYDVQKFAKAAKVAILSKEGKYNSYNLTGESYDVEFNSTDVRGVYLYRNYFPETKEFSKAQAVISKSGEMEYTYDFPEEYLKIKLGDSYETGTRVVNILKWTRIFPENKQSK